MHQNYIFLVVDDEHLSRSYIKDLLNEFVPGATILEARSAGAARSILEEGCVDVLLLDIRMPGMDGFALLETLPDRDFELVFVTAHSHYAIDAIKQDASDYLLKPIKKTLFRDMLFRVLERRRKSKQSHNGNNDETMQYLHGKLVINHQQGMNFIRFPEILYFKANNTYTTIYLTTGQKITTSRPISKYESSLNPEWFFRIHKSYIINIAHITEYISTNGNIAAMDNGDKLYISRYRLPAFLEAMRQYSEKTGS
jgi:two-component system LytT family response regulator